MSGATPLIPLHALCLTVTNLPHSLQANSAVVPQNKQHRFLSYIFQVHYY
jgi:hypothetical protein